VTILQTVTAPLIWVLSHSTNAVARLLGVRPGSVRPGVTEEEIKLLVTEQGTLLDDEKRMIHEIFELGDMVAKEIMVPRVDTRMLEDTTPVSEAITTFRTSGFSRLPVFHGDADTIVGIAMLKDLVGPVSEGRLDVPVSAFVRPAVFVPETKPILVMLKDMQAARNHLAVVVDEYGGTAGIVTIEDIVERSSARSWTSSTASVATSRRLATTNGSWTGCSQCTRPTRRSAGTCRSRTSTRRSRGGCWWSSATSPWGERASRTTG
jgi:putative hemolysin